MDRKELGRRIAEKVKNENQEVAQKTIQDINSHISNFYQNDIDLEGHYDEVQSGSSAYMSQIRVFDTILKYNLEETKILVTKEEKGQVTNIDEINIKNGKAYCEHGEFSVKEIDKHLVECFKNLF